MLVAIGSKDSLYGVMIWSRGSCTHWGQYTEKTCRGVASGRDILAPQIRPSLSLGEIQLVYLAIRGLAMTDTPCLWPQTLEKTLARSFPNAYRCGRRGGEFSSCRSMTSYPSFRKCKIDAGVFWLFAVLKDTTRIAGIEGREGGGWRKYLGLRGLCTWGGGWEGGWPNGRIAGSQGSIRCRKRCYVGRVLVT